MNDFSSQSTPALKPECAEVLAEGGVEELEGLHARVPGHCLCPLDEEEPADGHLCLRQRYPETGHS